MFPVYQRVKGINGSALLGLDLTEQWVYFYGDSTTHQLHEQFLDYMDSSSQVRCQHPRSCNDGCILMCAAASS